ncbi:DUF551 domain-containing protein [Klebsiella pneumoniae]|nr:DUF551 domain-containing protein [Klebsiella pneumoniae]WKI60440.1 DUF551 domain-containing protein [Klebsiella pneumoniae]
MALAVMDSESGCLPLDYLQGHKDGLEWAAQLAEANHPETGDWLYDDPIDLAKAIRKGPDMPPAQPVADSEPVAWTWQHLKQWHVTNDEERARDLAWDGVKVEPLYRHAQPVPVVSAELLHTAASAIEDLLTTKDRTGAGVWFDLPFRLRSAANAQPALVVPDEIKHRIGGLDWGWEGEFNRGWNACRAATLAAAPHDTPALNSVQSVVTVPGKWIPVSERMPENDGAYLCWDNRYVTTYAFIFGAWQANQFIAKNITHWMPLPAGPQEVR